MLILYQVSKFARATGDFTQLSQTDLLLIALVYDLQKEIGGVEDINLTPLVRVFNLMFLLIQRDDIIDVNEKRIVGVNVMNEPCKFFSTPESCPRGRNCFYRHSGDIERPRPTEAAPKKEVPPSEERKETGPEAETAPSKPRVVKGWNIKKTSGSFFANDDRFPTLGSHKSEEKHQKDKEILTMCATPEFKARFATKENAKESESSPMEKVEERELNDLESDNSVSEESQTDYSDTESEDLDTLSVNSEDNSSLLTDPTTESAAPTVPPSVQGSHIITSSSTLTSTVRPEDEEDEEDNEWISSETLGSFDNSRVSRKAAVNDSIDRSRYAACCTSDYSMQNVLLQMKLQVISYDNKLITRLKSWTRRCRDCFRQKVCSTFHRSVCNDDTRLFCPDCGHPSLARVPVYTMRGMVRIGFPLQSKSLRGTIVG